jgi:hypothetical protein
MDLKELKNIADNAHSEGEKRTELINEAVSKYKEFKNLCNELSPYIEKLVAMKKEDLYQEFEVYFSANGFEITKSNNKSLANYNGVSVALEDESPEILEDEKVISLRVPAKHLYDGIVIRAKEFDSDKFYFKNILRHNDEHIGFENYEEIIQRINKTNELEHLILKINENIEWYKETQREIEMGKIKLVYSLYKSDKEFNTFEDLFKAL